MKRKRYGFIILLWILLCLPRYGAAGINEQLAIDTRAMSLGNSVTADPQGPFSVHYNPAGLDRTIGTEVTQGLNWVPILEIKGKFTQGTDPATGKPWAPFGGWFNNGIDPEAGHSSTTSPVIATALSGHTPLYCSAVQRDRPSRQGFALCLRLRHRCALRGWLETQR